MTIETIIPGQLSFREQPGGLLVAKVGNRQATATIALQGAHLMTWTQREAHRVIWLSPAAKFAPGKSIRGLYAGLGNLIKIKPALDCTRAQMSFALDVLDDVLGEIEKSMPSARCGET